MKALILTLLVLSQTTLAVPVLFERDDKVPLVFLSVVVKEGYTADPESKEGLINFVGEMLLRGTKNKKKDQIDLAMDNIGAKFYVDTQAHAVVFRGAVIQSELEPFLALFKEILTEPAFPKKEIKKLKAMIATGITNGLNYDGSVAGDHFRRFFFHGHPYSQSALGKLITVKHFKLGDLMRKYNEAVREKNMMIFGVGDADPARVESWAQELAKARSGGKAHGGITAFEPRQSTEVLLVNKDGRTQTQVIVGQEGTLIKDENFIPLYVGNYAFGGGTFSSRLFQEIRVKRGWSYGAGSSFAHGLQKHSWRMSIAPKLADTPDAVAHLIKMAKKLKEEGITEKEFRFAQKSLINSDGFRYDTPQKRIANRALEMLFGLPEGFQTQYAKKIQKLTLEQVNNALKAFLKPEQFQIAVLGPSNLLRGKLAQSLGVPRNQIQTIDFRRETYNRPKGR